MANIEDRLKHISESIALVMSRVKAIEETIGARNVAIDDSQLSFDFDETESESDNE